MNERSRKYFIYAQLIFYFCIATCLLIRPHGLIADNGISYYGTFLNTVFPYSLGILGAAYFFYRSAQEAAYPIKLCLKICSYFMVGVCLTPYTINNFFNWAHIAVSSAVFVVELLLGLWLVVKPKYSAYVMLFWLLMLLSGIASAIYLLPSKGYLLETQLLYQASFGLLVLSYLRLGKPIKAKLTY